MRSRFPNGICVSINLIEEMESFTNPWDFFPQMDMWKKNRFGKERS